VALDKHRFRVLNFGRRTGKTMLAVEEIKGFAIYKEANIKYIATTFQQARDITWNLLVKEFAGVAPKINETRLEIEVPNIKKTTSKISLGSWDNIDTLRGQSFDFIVIDEVAQMKNFWEKWQEVIRPTLLDRTGHALFCSTPLGFNHWYELYNLENEDKEFKSFHATTYDNPHIPVLEIEALKGQLTEDRFAQEIMADFRKVEGLVYKEFDRSKHLYDLVGPISPVEKLIGIDWGYTNPAAVLTIVKDYDATFWVTNEWYERGKTTDEIVEYAASLKGNKYYADPAEPDRVNALRKKKLNVREVNKDVVAGIDAVRTLFKNNKIKIHSSCRNLILELETYTYKEKKVNSNEPEEPVKENDHLCFTADANINIPLGQRIHRVSMGKKDVYEFMGSKVTANHPYLTPRGFVRLDALRYSDKIVLWKNKLLTELFLDGTQTQTGVSLKSILHLLHRNVLAIKQNVSTDIYGKNIMVQYLKVCKSIIETAILLTTSYVISNWYHQKNIIKDIIKRCCLSGKRILKKLFKRLVSGQKQKKDNASEGSLDEKMPNISLGIKLKEIAINVVKNILPKQREVSTATLIAELKHCGQEEVFALATTSGFFTANGVVVSNCDALRYVMYMNDPNPTKKTVYQYRPNYKQSNYGSPKIPA
jgi:hypothetical protein